MWRADCTPRCSQFMIIGLLVIERILEFTNHVMPYRRLLSTRAQLDHVFCVAPLNQKHARSTLHELKSIRNAQTNVPFIVTDRILDKQATCKSSLQLRETSCSSK